MTMKADATSNAFTPSWPKSYWNFVMNSLSILKISRSVDLCSNLFYIEGFWAGKSIELAGSNICIGSHIVNLEPVTLF